MDKYSYLSNGDVVAFEALYETYKKDNNAVDFGWQKFFEGFELASTSFEGEGIIPENFQKEFKVLNLINGYRTRGHFFTKTNPVRERRKYTPTLDIENFGLEQSDLDTVFQAGTQVGIGPATLRTIVDHLQTVYCQSIGVEYMYIRNVDEVDWIKNKLHINSNQPTFSIEEKKRILQKITEAVAFESFLHTKFVGQKRFSLEGAESLIPALDAVIQKGASLGVEEFVFGMAHRGRLNVLANIFGKSVEDIFNEFEGKDYEENVFDGDVKYHLGFSTDIECPQGKVHLSLTPNPSHLEAVAPVVEGISRAKIDRKYQGDNKKLVPVILHGDASIAGQGVVYEVVQMAQLDGYKTGGSIHIVINNQVGFTTNYLDARSSIYCTDVGKVTLSPIFHINGDDVEAVTHAINMAMEYRQRFHKDVFIDLLCYRKYGHNEGDEPRFTQPQLYKAIAKHPNPRDIYNKKLLESSIVEPDLAKKLDREYKAKLDQLLDESKKDINTKISSFLDGIWTGVTLSTPEHVDESPKTGVAKKTILELAQKITTLPKDKKFFKKIERIFEDRQAMIQSDALDWGMCELLAYATLLNENVPVRISGQDVERGTFSHRHAVVKVEDNEEEYVPLNHISDKQAAFTAYNSLLSEYGVLGFDYGYAMAMPNALTIWEAQFGDFSNGAQIVIDQFISCAEDKWRRMNGIVLLLPHGYEGQGAEHSSARMERYLQLCAEENMIMANCTTPANFFHILRRQLKWKFRKPLVVFTPKSLLRHPKCVSKVDELVSEKFQEVIDDTIDKKGVKVLAFCSGKLYYELVEKREELKRKDIAFVRIEQLYPLPDKQIEAIITKYSNAKKHLWVQEEPENMGAWTHMLRLFKHVPLELVSRRANASAATGSYQRHNARQQRVIDTVFSYK